MKKRSLEALNRLSVDDFKKSKKNRIIIVLDNLRSAFNVGSFFRTADAFACQEIILTGCCAQPPHPEINKTAIGADRSMSWRYEKEILAAVKELKANGVLVFAIEQTDASSPLNEIALPSDRDIALVFGNEVNGVAEEILPLVDGAIEVPQYGTKHSLNVAVCGGVVIWEVLQKIS